MLTGEQWHRRHHYSVIPIEDCRRCQLDKLRCARKDDYYSLAEVDAAVKEINEREGYADPVGRYPCRWGQHWHIGHPRMGRGKKWVEKARREWLLEQRLAHDAEDDARRVRMVPVEESDAEAW